MGLLHLQGLRRAMTTELVGIDIDPRKLELARACGAERTYHAVDEADALAKMEMHFDVVIEAAGAQPALDLAVTLVRRGGTLSQFSWHHGPVTIDGDLWHMRGLNVLCTSPSNAPDFGRLWAPTIRMMAGGIFDLGPLVSHTAPLGEIDKLLETGLDDPTYTKGVVVYD